jgi:trigger factor
MKVTVEDRSSVKKVLHIEVPQETVAGELDDAYQALKKTAKVKGFRPGKVPRSVLERLYRKEVQADVTSRLIQNAFAEAIREKDLIPVGSPKVDPPELSNKSAYSFDAEIEVRPAIGEIDFKGFELKKNLYKLSEKEVEAQLGALQKNLAKIEPITAQRAVQDGDYVLIDYEGFEDGKPCKETEKTENFTMKIGNAYISKQFDEGLIGLEPGETRQIEVTFDADYFNKKLAGHTVEFNVKLHEIREEHLPDIDDEIAKKLGPFETLEALKNQIRENLTKGYEKRIEQELNEQVFKKLLEKADFEVPDVMVQAELDHIIRDTERSFEYANKSMQEMGLTHEGLAEKYRETAKKQVRRHLILGKIIEQEHLEVSDEELEKGFNEMAQAYRQPVEHIKGYYDRNKEGLDLFKHTLLEKQAIRLIIDNSRIEEMEPELENKNDSTDTGSDNS